MKKLMSFLLAAILAVPVFSEEIDGINYSFDEGNHVATVTSKSPNYEGDVVIPATVIYNEQEYSVTSIGEYAFYNCKSLESVSIPEGVTSIGEYAFYNCTSLESVSIPEGVTSIGSYAFYECSSLTSVSIPEGVTSIGEYAFCWCTSLTSVTIPNSVISICSYAFYECSSLTSVSIPEGVTSIGEYAFCWCTSLTSVTIPNSVISICSYAFRECTLLESVSIPEGVTSIGNNAFSNATYVFLTLNRYYTFACEFGGNAVIYVPEEYVDQYKAQWPEHSTKIISKSIPIDYDVTVSARENSSDVMDKVNNAANEFDAMLNVVSLKVKGTINSYDIMVMRNKMLNLKYLDLSEAHIVYSSYEYCSGCHTEENVVGSSAFSAGLRKVKLPDSATSIGSGAFSGCLGLLEVKLPDSAMSIGSYAFSSCRGLRSIVLPNPVTSIGYNAFYSCSNLREVVFNPNLISIGSNAFYNCSKLESLNLPPSLETIESSAFSRCSKLAEIRIPEKISSIGGNAFEYCGNIRDIYTWTVQPTNINQNTFPSVCFTTATLHVPETAEKLYYWDTEWSQFQNIRWFNEPYIYFYLSSKDLFVDEETARLKGKDGNNPNADIYGNGGLVVEGDESQDLGDVNLSADCNGGSGSIVGGESGTAGSGANVNIDNLSFTIDITAGKWYFFSFPFDIPYSGIHFNGQFVWRYYDGGYRAEHGSGAWKNMEGTLVANRGYIFQGSKDGTLTLNVGKASIGGQDKLVALESHAAQNAQDAGWNLVGNPFTSYYELSDIGFSAPVTIWNGSNYEALSPADDDFTIYPFQAFFVHKPDASTDVTFKADYRETKNQSEDPDFRRSAARRRMARAASPVERQLINLVMTDEAGNADKTRVVFNPEKSMGYDIECDASKFIADDTANIYSIGDSNVMYAINERPEGDGMVSLGIRVPADGTYTIGATRMDCEMELVDMKTGTVCRLSDGDYTFTAQKGTDNDRFILRKAASAAVGTMETDNLPAEYYGLDGIVYGDKAPKGLSIRKGDNGKVKVLTK